MSDEQNQDQDPFAGFKAQAFKDGEPVEPKTSVPPVPDEEDDDEDQERKPRGSENGRGAERAADAGGAADDPFDLSEFSDDAGSDDEGDPEDDDESGGDDADADDDLDGDPEDDGEDDLDDEDDRPKKTKSAKKRIAELTRLRREAERENRALSERIARLEGRLSSDEDGADGADGKKQDDKTQPDGNTPEVDLSDIKKPDPTDEKYKFGEVDSEYLADMVNYNVQVQMRKQAAADEAKRREAAAAEKQKALAGKWQQLGQKGLELHDDFAEVVFEGAAKKRWALSDTMGELIPDSEVGAQIAYHLARNPKESARVAGLSATEQARYFGRIEAKFLAQQRASKGSDDSGKTKRTKTPRKQPRGSGGRFTRTDAKGSFAEFERRVNEEQARAAKAGRR